MAPIAEPRAASVPPLHRPNVIVYLSDDQTLASMSAAVMPYLFSRPFGRWVTFDHLYYSTPACCPSRATMMTGAYSFEVGVVGNTLARYQDAETLPVWLQRAGYRTGLVGKYLNDPQHRLLTYRPPGWSDWHAVADVTPDSDLSENDYYDYVLNENGVLVPFGHAEADYQVDVLTGRAVDFIESTPADQPFYLQISPRNPHVPIRPAPRHENLAVPPVPLPRNFNEADISDKPAWIHELPIPDAAEQRANFHLELQAMRSVDESLHAVMDALVATGRLNETIVIFTTDNGYSRGSHRVVDKYCAYTECVSGQLWVRYPRGQDGERTEMVSNVDIAPTIGDLAGVAAAIPQDGVSLVPVLDGRPTDWRTDVLINWRATSDESPPYWAVRTEDWSYVEYDTGERELYDLVNDPFELVNLAGLRAYASVRRDMRQRLDALMSAAAERRHAAA